METSAVDIMYAIRNNPPKEELPKPKRVVVVQDSRLKDILLALRNDPTLLEELGMTE